MYFLNIDQFHFIHFLFKFKSLKKNESYETRKKRINARYELFLDVEKIACPEVVFQPSLTGRNSTPGIVEVIGQVRRE